MPPERNLENPNMVGRITHTVPPISSLITFAKTVSRTQKTLPAVCKERDPILAFDADSDKGPSKARIAASEHLASCLGNWGGDLERIEPSKLITFDMDVLSSDITSEQ